MAETIEPDDRSIVPRDGAQVAKRRLALVERGISWLQHNDRVLEFPAERCLGELHQEFNPSSTSTLVWDLMGFLADARGPVRAQRNCGLLLDTGTDAYDGGDLEPLLSLEADALRWLLLDFVTFGNDDLKSIRGLTELRALGLDGTSITGEGLGSIAALWALERLYLRAVDLRSGGAEHIASHGLLRELGLSRTGVSDGGVEQLSTLRSLEKLDVSETSVTDRGVYSLSTIPALTDVDLTNTNVGDDALEAISHVEGLRTLCLAKTSITDDALPALSRLRNLRWLDISATAVTAKGLLNLGRMESLWYLWVEEINIAAEELRLLQENLPNLAVLRSGSGDLECEMCACVHVTEVAQNRATCIRCGQALSLVAVPLLSRRPLLRHMNWVLESPMRFDTGIRDWRRPLDYR